jgi:cobalt-zinc-cadmium efflux system membrane fusion protein
LTIRPPAARLRLATLPASILCALLVAACGDKAPNQPAEAPAPRDAMLIRPGPDLSARLKLGTPAFVEVRETLRVPGRIEVDDTRVARVGAPVAGRVTDLAATVGQDVRRGQVLATISSTELSSSQLGYIKAESQRQLAMRGTTRAQQLYDSDVIGFAELQRRQGELQQAEAEVAAARDQLKVLGMPPAALERLAQTRSINSVAQIVASIAGTVIERKVTEGQVVQPADAVYVVADLSRVWVVADIPEQSAGLVRVGESVQAEISALPERKIAGTLSFVGPTVNPETRTVRARMELANPIREYKPAMLANVLIRGKPQKRLAVPVEAIVREENRDHVFVSVENALRLQPVTLGPEYEGKRVITGGIAEDASIVLDGAFHLNNERKRRALGGN